MELSAVRIGLARVGEHGAPAQRAEAARLLTIINSTPAATNVVAAAEQLIDAYLHDPYLEKVSATGWEG